MYINGQASMRACLDGLEQLRANHTVPAAKDKLDKYINQKANEQEIHLLRDLKDFYKSDLK